MANRRSQKKLRSVKICGKKLTSRFGSCLTSQYNWEVFCSKKRKEGKLVQLTECAQNVLRQHSIIFQVNLWLQPFQKGSIEEPFFFIIIKKRVLTLFILIEYFLIFHYQSILKKMVDFNLLLRQCLYNL